MGVRKLLLVMSLLAWTVCAADAQTLRVTADRTNLRDKPSTEGAIVASLVKGDELTVVERAGTWYRVRAKNGTEGYVSSLLVEVTAAAAATPPSSAAAPVAAPPAVAPTPAPTPVTQPATPPPTASVSTTQPNRTAVGRVMGGLLTGYGNAGFMVTAGVGGLRPFGGEKLELAIEGFIGRSSLGTSLSQGGVMGENSTSNTIIGAGSTVFYNFETKNAAVTPFVGAGLSFARESIKSTTTASGFGVTVKEEGTGGGSHVGIHFAGGLEKPWGDRRAFRAEIRTAYYGFGSLALLAGLSF